MVGELFHRDESEGASVGVAAGAMEASGMKIKIWRYDLALTHYQDAYRIEVGAWVDAIRSGVPVGPSAWDGHLANLAAFAAIDSLHDGGRVVVPREDRPSLYS